MVAIVIIRRGLQYPINNSIFYIGTLSVIMILFPANRLLFNLRNYCRVQVFGWAMKLYSDIGN